MYLYCIYMYIGTVHICRSTQWHVAARDLALTPTGKQRHLRQSME
jgi:hypothetical protein